MTDERKFDNGDQVRFDDTYTGKIYPSVVQNYFGLKTYIVVSEDGVKRWAYEHELTYA